MKKIILLGNSLESKRLNNLLRLKEKHQLRKIVYNSSGLYIDDRKIKAQPEDQNTFKSLLLAAGFSNSLPFNKTIQLYCDGILKDYCIFYDGLFFEIS